MSQVQGPTDERASMSPYEEVSGRKSSNNVTSLNIAGAPGVFQYLDDKEIIKQQFECEKITDAIATSTNEDEKSRLADIQRAIKTSLAHLQSHKLNNFLEPEELDKVVSARREIIRLAEKDDPLVPGQLASLGHALYLRFRYNSQLEDVTAAVDLYRESAVHMPSTPETMRVLYGLSWALMNRYELTHNECDIDEAANIMQDLADNMDPEGQDFRYLKPVYTLCIPHSLLLNHKQDLSEDEISQILDLQRKEIIKWPRHITLRFNLSDLYISCFKRTKKVSYLNMAIGTLRKTLSATPQPCQKYEARLRDSLETRYKETRNLEDLEEAIALQQCIIQTCQDDDPELASNYRILGHLYHNHYLPTPNIHDAQNATRAYKEALLRMPVGHSDFSQTLIDLGMSLRLSDSLDNISEAISFIQRAVDITACDGVEDPNYLGLLGKTLIQKYILSGDQCDLDAGINVLQKSVITCPPNHSSLSENIIQLALTLGTYYGDEKLAGLIQLETIDIVVTAMDNAIDTMHWEDENSKFTMIYQLGRMMYIRHKVTGLKEDIERSVSLFRKVTLASVAHPFLRVDSGKLWATMCLDDQVWNLDEALQAYKHIFEEAIPQVIWIGHTMEQRYIWLTNLEDFVREATSLTACCKEPNVAIHWLEQGRLIVWNQVNKFRMSLENLRRVDSALFENMEKTGMALNESSMRMTQPCGISKTYGVFMQSDVQKHQRLAKKWDSLLSEVRSIPGFEYFLQYDPTSYYTNLAPSLPQDGFVIVVNTHHISCDAFIITGLTPDLVLSTKLPIKYDRIIFLREALHKLLSNSSVRMRMERAGRPAKHIKKQFSLLDILKELWYKIVKPILRGVGLKPISKTPRIWWCPTGPLAFLPLHAAGDYSKDAPPGSNVMEYAISSYTPTLTTLAQGLSKHRQQQSQSFKGILAVSEPEAPNLPRIPNTTPEIRSLEELCNSFSQRFKSKEGADATVKEVLEDMTSYSWVHLSCHALQNDSPLNSAFYLRDGPLTLRDIVQHPLPDAQFAFLSACETGKGDKKLSEEAVHLAGGMIAAGYTSVIATMWSIKDDYAPQIAKSFYTYILQLGKEEGLGHDSDRTWSAVAAYETVASRIQESELDDDEPGSSYYNAGDMIIKHEGHVENFVQRVQKSINQLKESGGCDYGSTSSKEKEGVTMYPDCTKAADALHHAVLQLRASVGDDEESLLLWVPYIHVGI